MSLLIRSPGFSIPNDFGVHGITLDTYVTSRAVADAGDTIQEVLATFIQVFGKEVVIPHLHRFTKRCESEHVRVPFEPGMCKFFLINYCTDICRL